MKRTVWKKGTTGVPVWKGDRWSWGDMILVALLAVLIEVFWGVRAVDLGRNQQMWLITMKAEAGALETGLSIIVDGFDEVSALLFC